MWSCRLCRPTRRNVREDATSMSGSPAFSFRPHPHNRKTGGRPPSDAVVELRAGRQHLLGAIEEGVVIHQLANDGERANDMLVKPLESAPPAMVRLLKESPGDCRFFFVPAHRGVDRTRVPRARNTGAQMAFGPVVPAELPPRAINRSHPVLGSCRERSMDGVLFLVPAANVQRIASCSWFPSRAINGSHPVLGSCHERSTDGVPPLPEISSDADANTQLERFVAETKNRMRSVDGSWRERTTGR